MKFKIIDARIKRNKLAELAGVFYKDNNSQLIKHLNSKNKKALLGIQKENGIYTVIGEEFIYYSTMSRIEGEISHAIFLKILKENALNLGKKNDFEFIKISEQDSIWLLDGGTMNAIWNTVLLLDEAKIIKFLFSKLISIFFIVFLP